VLELERCKGNFVLDPAVVVVAVVVAELSDNALKRTLSLVVSLG
jgi:hypothetical protein